MDHQPVESLFRPGIMDLKAGEPELLKRLNKVGRIVSELVLTHKGFLITRIDNIR